MENNFTFIIHLSSISMILGLSFVLRKYLKGFNFYSIFVIVWLFTVLGSQILDSKFIVDDLTLLVLYASSIAYLFGCFTYSSIFKLDTVVISQYENNNSYSNSLLKLVIFTLLMLNIFVSLDLYSNVAGFVDLSSNLSALRSADAINVLQESRPLYQAFGRSYLLFIPASVYLYSRDKISKYLLMFLLFSALVLSAMTFTRAPILQTAVTIIMCFYRTFDKKLARILPALLGLAVFVGFTFVFMQDVIQKRDVYATSTVSESVYLYLFSGAKAYENIIQKNYSKTDGFYSLDSLNYVLKKIRIIEEYPDLVREYTNSSTNTNVYTFLDAYTIDFGIYGSLFCCFFLGIFCTYVFHFSQKNANLLSLITYSYICYALSITFLNNEFIRVSTLIIIFQGIILELIARKSFLMNVFPALVNKKV